MSLCYLLGLTLLCTPLAWGYNTGAREDSCYEMQVEHTTRVFFPIVMDVLVPAEDCASSCDFSLTMVGKVDYPSRTVLEENSTTYECGKVYELLLASSHFGAYMEGWLLEARKTVSEDPTMETFSSMTSMWGQWLFDIETDPYHTITCNRSMLDEEVVENVAATHNLRQALHNFSLYWKAPSVPTNEMELENLPRNITFWFTMVQQRLLYYLPIPGPTLSRDCAVPVPTSPTSTPMTPPTNGPEPCSTREEVRELHEKLEEHNREVNQTLAQIITQLDAITSLVASCGSHMSNATSCKCVRQGSPSGTYWIQSGGNNGSTVQVYCDMTRQCCGSRGGWMRVAHLDMTDPDQHCPPGFRLVTSPRRTCRRSGTGGGCASVVYPAHGVEYWKVCGRVTAYQLDRTDAFWTYYQDNTVGIDTYYVDGISVTHGNTPRKHIWTFAAAGNEANSNRHTCPCTRSDRTYTGRIPPFIGQDYFCETGSRYYAQVNRFYTEDPLWDGMGCGSISTCCSFNNPPWFCKELPQPTTDDIELRLCASWHDEDTPIELIELYVQ